jgi:uncharacterized RDD family membrane protein YckC
MEAKEKNNVISLVDHLKSQEEIETFNPADIGYFKIQNDKIMQRRVYSFITDFSVVMLLNTAVHVSYSVFVKNFMFVLNIKQQGHLIANNLPVQLSIFMLIYTTYFFYSMFVLNGQSVGKMVFKLKTVTDNFIFEENQKDFTPSASQAWRRTFGYIACYLSFGTFFLFSFMSEDKRGVPDYFSQTRTVSNEWLEGMIAYKEHNRHEVKIDIVSLDKAA